MSVCLSTSVLFLPLVSEERIDLVLDWELFVLLQELGPELFRSDLRSVGQVDDQVLVDKDVERLQKMNVSHVVTIRKRMGVGNLLMTRR